MTVKVLEFKREGWRDAVRSLRKIADDLESGRREACSVGVIGLRSERGGIDVFGFGPMANDMQSLALFRLGEQKLIDVLLEGGET
ncbi:hypothetical protein C1Y08_20630 [Pseudomonas sp. FW306-02-F02-AA]|uniref:Uncharacterized protein n=1 Tax=Pseudomonas fluorescens TaxID=294 RepID=A0A0N7H0Y0_PSEFL|nr:MULTISPECIES: hypothetical protein [Pseudomonas]ALI04396.1 hypothetical protein AO353_26270 [Pseudomonas fluorescens]PMZ03873.1 hypothetical protein C1Y07_11725 [Pseudomonas sp. FW306-02-F02-AB]PMZ08238.1 hypothetical protein C1Y06_20065 [Pseudomonas sp. FW306-02-H06C]PMZ13978.1 hypothetical protein C1Y08_20630 [Pseudomonas sp. FW306-02-F02-AA]PMZ21513.1 hypothetical protein C1Y09_13825 [Pseudomonas sp. FW306-02-F08-AA]